MWRGLTRKVRAAASFFPREVAWGLADGPSSGALKPNRVGRCGWRPYEQAAAVLVRIGQPPVSDSRLWRRVQQAGHPLGEQAAADQSAAARVARPAWAEPEPKRLRLDGGLVNSVGAGWKAGTLARVGSVVAEQPKPSDRVPKVQTQVRRSSAVLGAVAAVTPVLLELGRRTHLGAATHSGMTADGAPWIWHLAAAPVPTRRPMLDGSQARPPVSVAAQALFPDQPTVASACFQAHTDDGVEGPRAPTVTELDPADRADVAAYFRTHHARMA
jgi:hypothetical protein